MTSRGKNFTEREKCKLLELVLKYKDIIENKCTNAVSTLRKNEAWESITFGFNSSAEIPRTQKQLKAAYLNLKRTTRQNVASENVKIYLEKKQNISPVEYVAGPSRIITSIDELKTQNETAEIKCILKQFNKDEVADKKGVRATGGGIYKPILSNIGAQMLAVMGDQLKPLSNNCDSASSYYINNKDLTTCDVLLNQDILQPLDKQDYNDSPPPTSKTSHSDSVPQTLPVTTTTATTNSVPRTSHKIIQWRNVQNKKNTQNNDLLKRKYYLKKMECAMLEKKSKLLEYRMAVRKQKLLDLEIKIKQKEYENILNK